MEWRKKKSDEEKKDPTFLSIGQCTWPLFWSYFCAWFSVVSLDLMDSTWNFMQSLILCCHTSVSSSLLPRQPTKKTHTLHTELGGMFHIVWNFLENDNTILSDFHHQSDEYKTTLDYLQTNDDIVSMKAEKYVFSYFFQKRIIFSLKWCSGIS